MNWWCFHQHFLFSFSFSFSRLSFNLPKSTNHIDLLIDVSSSSSFSFVNFWYYLNCTYKSNQSNYSSLTSITLKTFFLIYATHMNMIWHESLLLYFILFYFIVEYYFLFLFCDYTKNVIHIFFSRNGIIKFMQLWMLCVQMHYLWYFIAFPFFSLLWSKKKR